MNKIRNIAISGVTNEEQYRKLCDICGDIGVDRNDWVTIDDCYPVFYDNQESDYFMYNWNQQDYAHCTLYTYEEFIVKFDKKETTITRTFANKEELRISLMQGEKWSLGNKAVVYEYDKLNNTEPFRAKETDRYSNAMDNSYIYCDGKTLWSKVEDKPKKKTVTIIKFYSSEGNILEMDKSRISGTLMNIIEEYEIEVYEE